MTENSQITPREYDEGALTRRANQIIFLAQWLTWLNGIVAGLTIVSGIVLYRYDVSLFLIQAKSAFFIWVAGLCFIRWLQLQAESALAQAKQTRALAELVARARGGRTADEARL